MPTATRINSSVGTHLRQGERFMFSESVDYHLREVGNIPRVVLPRELLHDM